jgi:hypothetical protein
MKFKFKIHAVQMKNQTQYHRIKLQWYVKRHKYHLRSDADTCVLGQGWEVLSAHITRRANVVGFDHEDAVKWNLSIVSAITAVDLPDGISVILIVHEAIYNDTANHSLLSELQLRDSGVKIDSICDKH